MPTLYWWAIEVRVSPRVTTWVDPPGRGEAAGLVSAVALPVPSVLAPDSPLLLDHLLQLQDLLGKRVDLGVLRVDLLAQSGERSGIARAALSARRDRR